MAATLVGSVRAKERAVTRKNDDIVGYLVIQPSFRDGDDVWLMRADIDYRSLELRKLVCDATSVQHCHSKFP